MQEAFEGFCKNLDTFWFFKIFIKLHKTPKVGIKNFAYVVPFIERNLAVLENEDFCRDNFNLYLTFANEDGLKEMKSKCLEVLVD